ncbi:hypothetical protein [Streptomyces coelicoflavus]|uniref:hypothetical protein n=1 Tax=Streptomyces coelicoflavus TaxID=285562 RepID=UPI003A84B90C
MPPAAHHYRDPSGQEANPHLYAGGDPINNTDPSRVSLLSLASGAMKKEGVASDILAMGQFAGSTKRRQAPRFPGGTIR